MVAQFFKVITGLRGHACWQGSFLHTHISPWPLQVPAAEAVKGAAETAQHVQNAVAEGIAPALAPAPAPEVAGAGAATFISMLHNTFASVIRP